MKIGYTTQLDGNICLELTKSVLKHLIYVRGHIPVPCVELEQWATRHLVAEKMLKDRGKKRRLVAGVEKKAVKTAEQIILMLDSLSSIFSKCYPPQKVVLLFGASALTPKEVYVLTFSGISYPNPTPPLKILQPSSAENELPFAPEEKESSEEQTTPPTTEVQHSIEIKPSTDATLISRQAEYSMVDCSDSSACETHLVPPGRSTPARVVGRKSTFTPLLTPQSAPALGRRHALVTNLAISANRLCLLTPPPAPKNEEIKSRLATSQIKKSRDGSGGGVLSKDKISPTEFTAQPNEKDSPLPIATDYCGQTCYTINEEGPFRGNNAKFPPRLSDLSSAMATTQNAHPKNPSESNTFPNGSDEGQNSGPMFTSTHQTTKSSAMETQTIVQFTRTAAAKSEDEHLMVEEGKPFISNSSDQFRDFSGRLPMDTSGEQSQENKMSTQFSSSLKNQDNFGIEAAAPTSVLIPARIEFQVSGDAMDHQTNLHVTDEGGSEPSGNLHCKATSTDIARSLSDNSPPTSNFSGNFGSIAISLPQHSHDKELNEKGHVPERICKGQSCSSHKDGMDKCNASSISTKNRTNLQSEPSPEVGITDKNVCVQVDQNGCCNTQPKICGEEAFLINSSVVDLALKHGEVKEIEGTPSSSHQTLKSDDLKITTMDAVHCIEDTVPNITDQSSKQNADASNDNTYCQPDKRSHENDFQKHDQPPEAFKCLSSMQPTFKTADAESCSSQNTLKQGAHCHETKAVQNVNENRVNLSHDEISEQVINSNALTQTHPKMTQLADNSQDFEMNNCNINSNTTNPLINSIPDRSRTQDNTSASTHQGFSHLLSETLSHSTFMSPDGISMPHGLCENTDACAEKTNTTSRTEQIKSSQHQENGLTSPASCAKNCAKINYEHFPQSSLNTDAIHDPDHSSTRSAVPMESTITLTEDLLPERALMQISPQKDACGTETMAFNKVENGQKGQIQGEKVQSNFIASPEKENISPEKLSPSVHRCPTNHFRPQGGAASKEKKDKKPESPEVILAKCTRKLLRSLIGSEEGPLGSTRPLPRTSLHLLVQTHPFVADEESHWLPFQKFRLKEKGERRYPPTMHVDILQRSKKHEVSKNGFVMNKTQLFHQRQTNTQVFSAHEENEFVWYKLKVKVKGFKQPAKK